MTTKLDLENHMTWYSIDVKLVIRQYINIQLANHVFSSSFPKFQERERESFHKVYFPLCKDLNDKSDIIIFQWAKSP